VSATIRGAEVGAPSCYPLRPWSRIAYSRGMNITVHLYQDRSMTPPKQANIEVEQIPAVGEFIVVEHGGGTYQVEIVVHLPYEGAHSIAEVWAYAKNPAPGVA
jgi:hypothetical protein